MTVKTLTPTQAVQNVLNQCEVKPVGAVWHLVMPPLDRETYVAVNKFLTALGGTWNRSAKAHVFNGDPLEGLRKVESGETLVVDNQDFFPTPSTVAYRMFHMLTLPITDNTLFLEPSAGEGALIRMLIRQFGIAPKQIRAVELNPDRADLISRNLQVQCWCADFMELDRKVGPITADIILMNPPFSYQQDIDHVLHAYENFLRPGGQLVSVMSEGTFFRETAKNKRFWDTVQNIGFKVEQLPPDAFKESGTLVKTRLVLLIKSETA